MMKKIVISMLLLSAAAVLWAGPQSGRYAKIPLIEDGVTRAVANVQAAPTWQAQLQQIQKMYKQYPNGAKTGLPLIPNQILSSRDERVYMQRIAQLRSSIRGNKALKGFSFVAPISTDLANLSPDNYAALHAFLKGLRVARVTQTKRVYSYTLSLQIKGEPRGNVEIWIDVPTHNVYLMSDNLYTTSDGKYGLHLK